MGQWQKIRLRTKVNILLFVVTTVFLVIGLYWQYRQQRALLFAEAVTKAQIITSEATRTREYISRQLRAGDIELNKDRYGIIPIVAANRVGQLVGEDLDYTIRHTSLRVRNPDNAPDSYEQAALRRFAEGAKADRLAEFTRMDGVPVFRYLQAAYADESCLECHGDPRTAPAFLQEIYPPEKDTTYRYREGEVIGAVSIVIPMAPLEQRLAAGFRTTLLATTGFCAALAVSLGLLLRRAVLRPLNKLATAIGDARTSGRFTASLPVSGQDEIGELVRAYNALGEELTAKTDQLEESERRFRLLIEAARDAIIAFLPSGKIFLFNGQAEKLFGYSQRDLLGEPIDSLFMPAEEAFADGLTACLGRAGEGWFREVHLLDGQRKDRATVRLEIVITLVNTGERPFYMATLRSRGGDAR
jgi:PAS domain S-box-containing protein